MSETKYVACKGCGLNVVAASLKCGRCGAVVPAGIMPGRAEEGRLPAVGVAMSPEAAKAAGFTDEEFAPPKRARN